MQNSDDPIFGSQGDSPIADTRQRDVGRSTDHIYEQLFGAVVDQRLLPGTKLTEQILADSLNVSRRAVGAALQRLAWEKLVVMVPNRGSFIASPGVDEVHQVFGARIAIEAGTTEAVARNATEDQLAELTANLEAEHKMRSLGRMREAIHLSGGFHIVMANMSGNMILAEQVRILVARTSLIVDLFDNQTGMTCWHDHHNELIEHCRLRRVDQAVTLMREHILELKQSLALDRRRARPFNFVEAFPTREGN